MLSPTLRSGEADKNCKKGSDLGGSEIFTNIYGSPRIT